MRPTTKWKRQKPTNAVGRYLTAEESTITLARNDQLSQMKVVWKDPVFKQRNMILDHERKEKKTQVVLGKRFQHGPVRGGRGANKLRDSEDDEQESSDSNK
jgi:hypothetical protein